MTRISQSLSLRERDRDIAEASKRLEKAGDAKTRAAALSQRGRAYSEKARYSRAFHLIAANEYDRLFTLALRDHDQAIALEPERADFYFARGHAHFDHASLDQQQGSEGKPHYDAAAADFSKAVEKNSRHSEAWDMLGLVYQSTGDFDRAIEAYRHEMEFAAYGKVRLADAHCERGSAHQKAKRFDAALADFETAMDLGASADGCSCDPYNPLVGLYLNERRNHDKAWTVVRRAAHDKKFIAPELLQQLMRDSGRTLK